MNPDKYDGGKVTVKDVLVFPLKVVGAIALWIVGVWMMLLGLALTLGIPIVIGIVIYSAVFNGGGNGSDTITVEEDAADSSQDYLGQISPSLERALDVSDEWNRLQEELNQIDLTRLSLSEAENLVEEELADAGEEVAQVGVVEEVGGVLGPQHEGVDGLGAQLPQAAGEVVGVVVEQLGAPGGADDFLGLGGGGVVTGHFSAAVVRSAPREGEAFARGRRGLG